MTSNRPNIVVLDGYTLNPGDLSWDRLQALGHCTIHDRTPPDQVVERAGKSQLVLTNKALLTREAIAELPALKYIGVTATGYNVVDIEAARERNIPVTNVPTYGTSSVAQMVFAHLLNLTQHVAHHAAAVRAGRWAQASDWCFWDYPLLELDGLTMGIVGLGRIGARRPGLLQPLGCAFLAHTVTFADSTANGVQMVDLETLFRESDVVSLHCPLTPVTTRLVNRYRLSLMKPTAYLINTSRGPLVDEEALSEALQAGRLAGAGLDVVDVEPPQGDLAISHAPNCQITPHIAWATYASRQRLLHTAIDNVEAYLQGRPHNVVNGTE